MYRIINHKQIRCNWFFVVLSLLFWNYNNNNNVTPSLFVSAGIQNINLILDPSSTNIKNIDNIIDKNLKFKNYDVVDPSEFPIIYYMISYIEGPNAYIDLSQLQFSTINNNNNNNIINNAPFDTNNNSNENNENNDNVSTNNDNNENTTNNSNDTTTTTNSTNSNDEPPKYRRMMIRQQQQQQIQQYHQQPDYDEEYLHRQLQNDDVSTAGTTIDIVVFELPNDCEKDPMKPEICDYSKLGIGKRSTTTVDSTTTTTTKRRKKTVPQSILHWCCSKHAIQEELCTDKYYGRLLINTTLFAGHHMSIDIPQNPIKTTSLNASVAYITNLNDQSNYIIMHTNCYTVATTTTSSNDTTTSSSTSTPTTVVPSVQITGQSIVVSKEGSYLPGGFDRYMNSYLAFTVIYGILFVWYFGLMYMTGSWYNFIEKSILLIIILGLFEVMFRTIDYKEWDTSGYRFVPFIMIGITFGTFKQALSRCLLVMISYGYGILQDASIPCNRITWIFVLGIIYTFVTITMKSIILVPVEEYVQLSYNQDLYRYDNFLLLSRIQVVLDSIFIVWIVSGLFMVIGTIKKQQSLSSLKNTTNHNQKHVQQIQSLLKLLIVSIFIGIIITLVSWIDRIEQNYNSVILLQHTFVKNIAIEINTTIVVIGIAILWQPTSSNYYGSNQHHHQLVGNNTTMDDIEDDDAILYDTTTTKKPKYMNGTTAHRPQIELRPIGSKTIT